jgi:hypothetical protein
MRLGSTDLPAQITNKLMIGKAKHGKSRNVRPLGMHRGSVVGPDDFNAPLPPEPLALFLGESTEQENTPPKKSAASKLRRISVRKSRGI